MTNFSIEIARDREGRQVVAPVGELDLASHLRLRRAIDQLIVDGQVDLVLDLDRTTFLDSTGLGALISARRKVHAFRGSLTILCNDPRLLELFRITSLDRVFTIQQA